MAATTKQDEALTLQVPDDAARRLHELARLRGTTCEKVVVDLIDRDYEQAAPADHRVHTISDEEFERRFEPGRPTMSVDEAFASARRKLHEMIAEHEASRKPQDG